MIRIHIGTCFEIISRVDKQFIEMICSCLCRSERAKKKNAYGKINAWSPSTNGKLACVFLQNLATVFIRLFFRI